MNPEIHTLTGVYAVGALSDTERVAFERHLAECAACREEVEELRETAARLGSATAIEPSDQMRQRVLAEIATTRQLPPPATQDSEPPVRSWRARVVAFTAAAAVLVAVVLGVQVLRTQSQLDSQQQQLAAMSELLTASDAVTSHSEGIASGSATAVLSRSKGKVMVMVSGLPATGNDQSYQLWLINSEGPHSAGLLRPDTETRMEPVLSDAISGVSQVGVTLEPAGGSPQPTTNPVLKFSLA